jgi:hypothetical protein
VEARRFFGKKEIESWERQMAESFSAIENEIQNVVQQSEKDLKNMGEAIERNEKILETEKRIQGEEEFGISETT